MKEFYELKSHTLMRNKWKMKSKQMLSTRRHTIFYPGDIVICNEDHPDKFPRLCYHKRQRIPAKSTEDSIPAPQQWINLEIALQDCF